MTSAVMDPANNNHWGPNHNETRTPIFAESELNPAMNPQWDFNANIAFADGTQQSYWTRWTTPTEGGTSYDAQVRTH